MVVAPALALIQARLAVNREVAVAVTMEVEGMRLGHELLISRREILEPLNDGCLGLGERRLHLGMYECCGQLELC